MKIALLGMAQSGKKTLFTLLTGRDVSGAMKQGELLEGVAPIRDKRIDVLSSMYNPKKTTYAENQIILCPDIRENNKKEGVKSAVDFSNSKKANQKPKAVLTLPFKIQ
jgi:hypothetical protein